jgi:hypothetical protein
MLPNHIQVIRSLEFIKYFVLKDYNPFVSPSQKEELVESAKR